MAVRRMPDEAPEEFQGAIERLRAVRLRPEVVLEEVPAPQRIAPHAVAVSADVVLDDEELATGRFVLLYDPAGQDAWEGTFRAVTFVRAALESELGSDPMLGQVGWTWLQESLESVGAEYGAAGGTVTRVVSESFGALGDRPATVEIEVRASWTPAGDVGLHLQAWAGLLCTVAGIPPLPSGVAPLPRRR
ncbi:MULTISPECIES: DUF3000 domain-containing protein [unclassified Kineosporia]|uniref:DUF3000 domain-containing protein n=1 Tax=unclassified Kineosporia TaxID=2626061 RepID=UPI001E4730A9|nr:MULTISPECIES: DUF3000 domain-containing protein [unclassified Kineosporia]